MVVANTDSDPLVAHPTWFGNVRDFFTETDVAHMAAKGIDLGTAQGTTANALSIYAQTQAGMMPPGNLPKWSANRVQTFLNWITDNYPLGTPVDRTERAEFAGVLPAARVRKEVADLTPAEIAKLKQAFAGMMARDPATDDSYFAIAGIHWFPAIDRNPTFHCLHHEPRFLAWHRIHLKRFEDALRTVPGCADVTLPYWDLTTPIPPVLYEAPFGQYTVQAPIGHGYDPYTTSKFAPARIAANLARYRIGTLITAALQKGSWELFNPAFWQVHDDGHDSIGPTMGNQDVSSFDPIFWVYHCNLDRLWLKWQQALNATTVAGFKAVCSGSTQWLDVPQLGALPPFAATAAQAIELNEIAYAPPAGEIAPMAFDIRTGNVAASRNFTIASAAPLSVRVKDINRSGIPGTFVVHLMADGAEVARQAFFQPTDPGVCPNCNESANVSVDFSVDPVAILDKKLSIEIHVPSQQAEGTRFPLSKAGNPTVNVRHLVEGE